MSVAKGGGGEEGVRFFTIEMPAMIKRMITKPIVYLILDSFSTFVYSSN